MCICKRRKSVSAVIVSVLFVSLSNPASAGLLDKIKETTSKTLEAVKDVKDTVVTGKQIEREVRGSGDVVFFEDSVTLSRDQVYQLQYSLNELGYDAGLPDGKLGGKTRQALKKYQNDNRLYADGSISYPLFQRITSSTGSVSAPKSPRLSRGEWREFQSLLNDLGFNAGPADGQPGPKTRRAVSDFLAMYSLSAASTEREALESIRQASNGIDPGRSAGQLADENPAGADSGATVGSFDPEMLLVMNSSESSAAARREVIDALALMVLKSTPDILDNEETLYNWFKRDGGTLESEYLREETLSNFKAELLARPVQEKILVQFEHDTYLRAGDYDKEGAFFRVGFRDMYRWTIPQISSAYFEIKTDPKLPLVKPDSGFSMNEHTLGIPMTLREAIDFENELFGENTAKRKPIHPVKLVSIIEITGAALPPLKINEQAGSIRYGQIDAKLHALSAYHVEGRRERTLAGKLHTWEVDQPAPTQVAGPADAPAISQSIEDIAARHGLRIFNGHLVLDGKSGQSFGAALSLGFKPKLLENRALVIPFAHAMLSRNEKRDIGLKHDSDRLDVLETDRLIDSILDTYKPLMLARALPKDLSVMVTTGASLQDYDSNAQRIPIRYQDRRTENGHFSLAGSGILKPFVINKTVLLPGHIDGDPETIKSLLVENNSKKALRIGLIGKLTAHRATRDPNSNRSVHLLFDIDTERLVALKGGLDESLMEFDLGSETQQQFARMMEAESAPLITDAALIHQFSDDAGVQAFLDVYLQGDRRIQKANEFDRKKIYEEVKAEFAARGEDHRGPAWLTGSIRLGEYDFDNGRFSISEMSLTDRTNGSSTCLRRCIQHNFLAIDGIKLSETEARLLVERYPQRTFSLRARTTPMQAQVDGLEKNPKYSKMSVSHRIDEIYLIAKERNSNNRQEWKLVASNIIEHSTPASETLQSSTQAVETRNSVQPRMAQQTTGEGGQTSQSANGQIADKASQTSIAADASQNNVEVKQQAEAVKEGAQAVTEAEQDVVGVKTGMLLADAEAIIFQHLGDQNRLELKREFTTKPKLFENAYVYVSPSQNEYFALFYEGSPESARVTGVLRNVRLVGNEFPRDAALGMLRTKYGEEGFIRAERSLNLAWGENVARTARSTQNATTVGQIDRTNRGRCHLQFNAAFPGALTDGSGTTLDTNQLFGVPQNRRSKFLKWPVARAMYSGRNACGQYLEAIHEQHEHPQVMVALFDLGAYTEALATEAQRLISQPNVSATTQTSSGDSAPIKF